MSSDNDVESDEVLTRHGPRDGKLLAIPQSTGAVSKNRLKQWSAYWACAGLYVCLDSDVEYAEPGAWMVDSRLARSTVKSRTIGGKEASRTAFLPRRALGR